VIVSVLVCIKVNHQTWQCIKEDNYKCKIKKNRKQGEKPYGLMKKKALFKIRESKFRNPGEIHFLLGLLEGGFYL
jgi:hypothetical protein